MHQNNTTGTPFISFVITSYNLPSELLAECIESILRLSLRRDEREIILVDDGSEICLLNGLMNYAAEITYVRQPNKGTAAARNMGIHMASGKYLQFIDGDDKLICEAYEHCIDMLRYQMPDIVIFNSTNKYSTKADYKSVPPAEGAAYLRDNNLHTSPWGYVFSRSILIDLRFNTALCDDNDEFTTLLFLRAEKVYSTSATAYFDRNRKEEHVDRHDMKSVIKHLNDMEAILIRLIDLSAAMAITDKTALQRRLAQLTMNYIIKTIRWTRSAKQLDMRIAKLEEHGLFPLPDKYYSKKYLVFNKLSRSGLIRRFLTKVLG